MTKLKVLHLIESLDSGGAERLLYTNLKHFDRDAVESEVVTVYSEGDFWKEPIEELGIPVNSLDCTGVRGMPAAVVRMQKHLRRTRPDVIHTHLWAANIVGRIAGRLARIAVISSIHNPDYEPESLGDGSDVPQLKRYIIRSLESWTARLGCTQMLAVSNYVKKSTHRRLGLPNSLVRVLYNPVDIEDFDAGEQADREKILKDLGISLSSVILLNVGRVSPQKGLIHAVRALVYIKNKFPDAHLISIGSKKDIVCLDKIEREASRLGVADSVHILGPRRDVQSFYKICDVFVFPSLHEGLGIALIEAMASGCACVATRTGPIPEFVCDGENGVLFDPGDEKDLADRISDLLTYEEKRKKMSTAARKTAQERFSPKPAADELTAIYRSVVDTKA